MRVLITGGLGFTGQAVARHLVAHGHAVTVLTHTDRPQFPAPPGATLTRADLRDPAAIGQAVKLSEVDAVCHLAALTRVRESVADPAGYFATNVGGTAHLLAALDQAHDHSDPPRFVLASSMAVYGLQEGQLSEDDPPAPAHPYGSSKLAAEQLVGHQAATGRLAGVSLRCFNIAGAVAGVGDLDLTRIIPKALAVAAGTTDVLQINGAGDALRDYTHVADVAEAYRLALEVARPGEHHIWNVGTGIGVSLAQVVESVERVTGRQVRREHLPPKAEAQAVLADNTRIRTELGWRPQRSGLDQIVQDGWMALRPAA